MKLQRRTARLPYDEFPLDFCDASGWLLSFTNHRQQAFNRLFGYLFARVVNRRNRGRAKSGCRGAIESSQKPGLAG